jgi:hypothetical protein
MKGLKGKGRGKSDVELLCNTEDGGEVLFEDLTAVLMDFLSATTYGVVQVDLKSRLAIVVTIGVATEPSDTLAFVLVFDHILYEAEGHGTIHSVSFSFHQR